MKKLFYILSLAAVASLTVLSCQKEQEVNPRTPSPAEVAGCYGVYFPAQEASGDHVFNPTQDPEIEITVARTNDSGAITVPVTTSFSEENIFVPQEIKFADGQKETTFKVRFDAAKEGVNYKASFLIEDSQYASLYNSNPVGLDFSVMRVEMKYFNNGKEEKTKIHWVQNFWGEEVDTYIKYYEVDNVRTCFTETIADSHFYKGEFYTGYGFFGTGEKEGDAEWTFTWYPKETTDDGEMIEIPYQFTGWVNSDNEVWVYDDVNWVYRQYMDNYPWLTLAKDGGATPSYYDGNGLFCFNTGAYIKPATGGGWYGQLEDCMGIAEGFVRVDYSFEVEADYPSDGETPIYLEAGIDVAGIKYAIYEGELTATQVGNKVSAITDGTDASVSFNEFELDEEKAVKYATLGVSPETTGIYTFVAVVMDKENKVQNSGSVTFNFVSADDQEEYEVVVSTFTEDTPARYTNLHKYDSFAYGISGKDLTEVHAGIFAEADIEEAGGVPAVVALVKKDAEKYGATAEDLAAINGEGGYYTVLSSGVKAKTTYYVIVWATNDSMDNYAVATYTTDPMPYVWNKIGKGTLTDGFLMPVFSMDDVTVSCDVYEEAITPGLYMVTGFQLELCAAFYEISVEEIEPYGGSEGQNWWNAPIIVDATDPTAVYIGEQDYGIYVNSTYGYVMIDSEPEGTLADGAITFPVKKMYIGLTKYGWLYGNSGGNFKITLPAAEAAAPALTPASAGSAKKTNFVMARDAQKYEKPVTKFERDPQPVKASVKVDYTRKEKSTDKKAFETEQPIMVR